MRVFQKKKKIFSLRWVRNNSYFMNGSKILFKVNNEIITTIDISNEINYIQAMNAQTNNLEKNILMDIAKNSLIREKIKKIEMLKNTEELTITNEYLNLLILVQYLFHYCIWMHNQYLHNLFVKLFLYF